MKEQRDIWRRVIVSALHWIDHEFMELARRIASTAVFISAVETLRLLQKRSRRSCLSAFAKKEVGLDDCDDLGNNVEIWTKHLEKLPNDCAILYSLIYIQTNSATFPVLGRPPPTHVLSSILDDRSYKLASDRISIVLKAIPTDVLFSELFPSVAQNITKNSLHLSFPAQHIALMNSSQDVAMQLWLESKTRESDVDLLARTFLHLVVERSDLNLLTTIAKSCPDAIKTPRLDLFGLSLLGTSALHGNQSAFSVLLGYDACTEPREEVFELALTAGNWVIMEHVLGRFLSNPPYTKQIETAIELGHIEMVEKAFWTSLTVREWHPPDQIECLAERADKKGHAELAVKLRNIEQRVSTPRDAIMDVDAAKCRQ
ncbi:hypothetical protein H2198_007671 [Neophaeococcomyces mojaviensis]|uniref:Uncharacterized protein n=1 Tax=Neophaeococcomyces mojaviensis TaxID=3383035 RepID=A0ACC2ZZD5_9EURO|nr:hypothetical protein H2198_007671 [Knufia sp. JES_112]